MTEAILGVDLGTTSIKAVLFDLSGQTLATAQEAYPLHTPQPGWVEQDPEEMWQAVVAVLRLVVEQAGGKHKILALSTASQCGSLLPADSNGTPITPIMTWMDSRAEDISNRWQADGTAAQVRQQSGWTPYPGLSLPMLAWLRENAPDTYSAAQRYFSVNDFINHRLTGQFCTDPSCAAEMLFLDVATGQWSQSLCDLVGIQPDQLSAVKPSGAVIGPISDEVSRLTSLSPETMVINGGHDHCCEALAMGMISAGDVLLTCGTAWVITAVTESPKVENVPANMDLNFHVVPQRWTVSQFLGSFGATMEWWLEQCWQNADPQNPLTRPEIFTLMDSALAESTPGCKDLLFLALGGTMQLPPGSSQGGFAGLRLDHTRADMSRAVLEGSGFELRWSLERLAAAGQPIEQLWMLGGAAKSQHWPTILADITGVPLRLAEYAHWAALGSAILAGVGVGAFSDVSQGYSQVKKVTRQVLPDESHKQLYDDRFVEYKKIMTASV